MGEIKTESPKAHPFTAVMYTSDELLTKVIKGFENRLGPVLGKGPVFHSSDFTKYYEKEFGSDIKKQFFVFQKPCVLDDFHKIKIRSNELELSLGDREKQIRAVNIDPGYLSPSKLVLFSTKNFSHRNYIGNGIYAEITMLFMHGNFKKLGWTYPDYYWENNLRFLRKMRDEIVRYSRENGIRMQ